MYPLHIFLPRNPVLFSWVLTTKKLPFCLRSGSTSLSHRKLTTKRSYQQNGSGANTLQNFTKVWCMTFNLKKKGRKLNAIFGYLESAGNFPFIKNKFSMVLSFHQFSSYISRSKKLGAKEIQRGYINIRCVILSCGLLKRHSFHSSIFPNSNRWTFYHGNLRGPPQCHPPRNKALLRDY